MYAWLALSPHPGASSPVASTNVVNTNLADWCLGAVDKVAMTMERVPQTCQKIEKLAIYLSRCTPKVFINPARMLLSYKEAQNATRANLGQPELQRICRLSNQRVRNSLENENGGLLTCCILIRDEGGDLKRNNNLEKIRHRPAGGKSNLSIKQSDTVEQNGPDTHRNSNLA